MGKGDFRIYADSEDSDRTAYTQSDQSSLSAYKIIWYSSMYIYRCIAKSLLRCYGFDVWSESYSLKTHFLMAVHMYIGWQNVIWNTDWYTLESIRFHTGLVTRKGWIRELALNPLGFSPLWFEPRSGHMWESQVLLTDGHAVFPGFSGLLNDRLDINEIFLKGP